MPQTALTELLEKFINESVSAAEVQQLRSLLKDREQQAFAKDWIEEFLAKQTSDPYSDFDVQEMFREVIEKSKSLAVSPAKGLRPGTHDEIPVTGDSRSDAVPFYRTNFLRTGWLRYAAVLLLIAGTAVLLYKTGQRPKQVPVQEAVHIMPGTNRAVLTLADGTTIVLDDTAKGTLANQGGTKIIKLDGGALTYRADGATAEEGYNTITTPRGGQYQVILPDGSQVWLNAASSIRFPVNTAKKERRLTVDGEVYVEVKKDPERPFYVTAGDVKVDVLGTSFNINAYTEEAAVKTTLLEGAVRLHDSGQESVLLNPGQQGVVVPGKHGINVQTTDTEEVLAWKNGLFKFNKANIDVVLRQIARWYDLDIVFEGVHPAGKFGGEIPRKASASTILEAISASGVKLRQEGRKIIVL